MFKLRTRLLLEAIPWFVEDDYQSIRSIISDGPQLPTSYETWRRTAETEEREMREHDKHPVRLVITP